MHQNLDAYAPHPHREKHGPHVLRENKRLGPGRNKRSTTRKNEIFGNENILIQTTKNMLQRKN